MNYLKILKQLSLQIEQLRSPGPIKLLRVGEIWKIVLNFKWLSDLFNFNLVWYYEEFYGQDMHVDLMVKHI